VPALLDRCRREAIGGVIDPATAERLEGFRSRPDVARLMDETVAAKSTLPVIDVHFAFGPDRLSFFSVVSTIGTPIDIPHKNYGSKRSSPTMPQPRRPWTGATE
jgi:hypothetical protein